MQRGLRNRAQNYFTFASSNRLSEVKKLAICEDNSKRDKFKTFEESEQFCASHNSSLLWSKNLFFSTLTL